MPRGAAWCSTCASTSPVASATQAHKHVLHVVVRIDGGQEVLHLSSCSAVRLAGSQGSGL